MTLPPVFVTGGTGYIGRPLIEALLARGYRVHALVRPGAETRLPRGAAPVRGDALDAATFATKIPEHATILRPWYVLGPGHRWPYVLIPVYALLRLLPATRDTAVRLGLVTRTEMTAALLRAVEDPPAEGARIVEVPQIRRAG